MNPKKYFWPGWVGCLFLAIASLSAAGEKQIVSLKDLSETQVKCAGFQLQQEAPVHARGVARQQRRADLHHDAACRQQ